MWNRPRSDLKVRLTLRVVAVSALCLAAILAYFLIDADRAARARMDAIAELAAKTLELQQNKIKWINSPRSEFPDLDAVAPSVMTPGLCLAFRAAGGETLQRFCGGALGETDDPPFLFATPYRHLFDPGRETSRPVMASGARIGDAVVWVDPAVLTAEAWHEARRLIVAIAIALPLLCALVYAALARALRPTRLISAGLARIAAGDLATRVPPFDLAELSAVGAVVNHLAESLGTALAERRELTRRLIDLQDEERRHLARELHDEFGQSLAAIRALAASARQSAGPCPELIGECEAISRTATDMMETLRGALFRLRPPDVEELGLAASLAGLVAGWNGRSRGRPRFEIGFSGTFDGLPASISANLYRIVQEALTNAAKHAGATLVALRVAMREREACPRDGEGEMDGEPAREIEFTMEDDGAPSDQVARPGMGLLGMRERVAALGGRLNFEAGQGGGAALRVVIPVASTQRRAIALECAA